MVYQRKKENQNDCPMEFPIAINSTLSKVSYDKKKKHTCDQHKLSTPFFSWQLYLKQQYNLKMYC